MLPFFSVIVPTYDRPDRLRECLRALGELRYPRDRYEVVVVDDGGRADLKAVVDALSDGPEISLLRQQNSGPASARNRGAEHARGTFLAFTDDDCRPDSEWLRAFALRFAETPEAMLGGRTVNALTDNLFSSASQRLVEYLYAYYIAAGSPFFTSNNIAVPRDRFLAVGGFRSIFRRAAGEDRDLCDRWLQKGMRMEYVEDAVVRHAHDMTARSFWRQHFNYGRAAFVYHEARRIEQQVQLTPEPIGFYIDLIQYPFRAAPAERAWRESCLLLVSQAANAVGYLTEKVRRAEAAR